MSSTVYDLAGRSVASTTRWVMFDGSVHLLKKDPDEKELKKLIMPADGNVIDLKKLEK